MSFSSSSGGTSGRAVVLAAADAVVVGAGAEAEAEAGVSPGFCGVGFALTGRCWWSVGLAGRSPVSVGPGFMETKVGDADMTSWSSSSCSVGMGRSSWVDGSMHSPQRVSRQSVKEPLWSFTFVSLTTTDHLPMPDSPLGVRQSIITECRSRSDSPVSDGHESPVDVAFSGIIKFTGHTEVADQVRGTAKFNAQIAATGMVDVHGDSDVFESLEVGFL